MPTVNINVKPTPSPLRRSHRWWVWAIAGMFILVLAVVGRTVWRMQPLLQSLHPERMALTSTDLAAAKKALGNFEAVSFKTADGLTLRGWYTPSQTGAVVVFVHGASNHRTWFIDEAGELVKRGIGVLLYDSRACGESEGNLQSWGDQEQNDVRAALDYVSARPEVNHQRIGLAGFSLGASTSALVAANDTRVHAVVLSALWSSLEDELTDKSGFPKKWTSAALLGYFAWQGVHVEAVRPIDRLAAISPRELVIVAGDHDADTPLKISENDYAAASKPKAFWMIPSVGHGQFRAESRADYLRGMADFFGRTL